MPRPQKHEDRKRTELLKVRVTKAEKNSLEKSAHESGYTVSDYLRTKAIKSLPLMRRKLPERQTLIRFLAELGKIGSNVNQIARALNRRSASENEPDVPAQIIAQSLQGIDALSHCIMKVLENGHSRTD